MTALLATLHDLIVGGAIAGTILVCCLIYAESRKERDEPTYVEIEEYEDPWSSLPPKWHPRTERYAGPRNRERLP